MIGRHLPPPADELPAFLQRFQEAYSPQNLSKVRQVIAVAAAHHRFLWIHPFYDGNGRVARLMSHALLRRLGVGNSHWSVARGLARNVVDYKSLLMAADSPRRGDLDGRGNLLPSRFILNARGEETATQSLGAACSFSGAISALKVPSAANSEGYCLGILPDSLLVGEHITIMDDSDRIKTR